MLNNNSNILNNNNILDIKLDKYISSTIVDDIIYLIICL